MHEQIYGVVQLDAEYITAEFLPRYCLPRFTSVVTVPNHALLQFVYSEHLKPITVCPTLSFGIFS